MLNHVEFIAWDRDGKPAYLADKAAVVRWAQRVWPEGVSMYRIAHAAQTVRPVSLIPEDGGFALATIESREWIPLDPCRDPYGLAVIDHFEEWGRTLPPDVEIHRVAPDRWDDMAGFDPVGGYHRHGFLQPSDTTEGWIVRYCPEIIGEQISGLSANDVHAYLSSLDVRFHMHINHAGISPEDMERLIDRSLYDLDPEASRITNEVQMRALDRRAAG